MIHLDFIVLVVVLIVVASYFIYWYRKYTTEVTAQMAEKDEMVCIYRQEMNRQQEAVAEQRDQLAIHRKQLIDSIVYAKRLQTALMPSTELFSEQLENFVLHKPLSIVSGDFYWSSRWDNIQVIIAADCTGHGIPGAFMSMLAVSLLNDIVNAKCIFMPNKIIEQLQDGVSRSLKKVAGEAVIHDGLDISVCTIDLDKNILWFSGANNSLYFVRDQVLHQYKADRISVSADDNSLPFTLHEIDLQTDDVFYIFSDGYADQFGGPNSKKFMATRFRDILVTVSGRSMEDQAMLLEEVFNQWKGERDQIDDVLVVGTRYYKLK